MTTKGLDIDHLAATGAPAARMGALPKAPTGIRGLDEVTGGLPRGRPTLVCGPAGCGKTLLAMEFLVRGIAQFDEPGVFVAFEESAHDLVANVASLGFDLAQYEADGKLVIDHVSVVRGEMEETGEWDLDGLLLRLGAAIDSVGAKRIVIDTIETLFGAFSNMTILRAELSRLFGWLKDRGVTAVITGERGDGTLTRHGIEEYVSDCVLVLDHRVTEQTSTRRLRILKYRGSLHGTNEYPFLTGESGVSVLPVTSLGLQGSASSQRVSTGVARLDAMLGDGGFYKGSGRRDARAGRPEPLVPGRPSSSTAPPAPASRRWRRSSATPRAAVASEPCTSPSRSPRRRSYGTCPRWESIWLSGWRPACCSSDASAPAFSASRRTSSP
jgi:KaiC/GvpD/RAD55 family RecA-like ATPase